MSGSRPLIGFIGQGWIGKNYADDFERRGFQTVRYSLEEPYVQNKDRVRECDLVFIAVPTPTTPEGFDASIVRQSVGLVAPGKVAIIKSTILPGTTKDIQRDYTDRIVFYSPEFLSEATAAHDTAYPFANIVGMTDSTPAQKSAAQLVHTVLPKAPFTLTCSSTEAEIIKYSHNGSGYTQIVFFNLMYDLATSLGCDWKSIQRAIEADPMVSSRYAHPIHKSGRGAGGHCFIKDVAALRMAYEGKITDVSGADVLRAMERKNRQLLRSTGKDLDLLAGVYGEDVLSEPVTPFTLPPISSVRGDRGVLVCTETIDRADPLLGYMHDWVEEFARHASSVTVLTLGLGERHLPANVIELTLGKGEVSGARFWKRARYALKLLRESIAHRGAYQDVLVHFSAEFVIVGAPLWKVLGKRVGFWHNDASGSWTVRLAARLSDVLFYSDAHSFVARYPHARFIPTGVNAKAQKDAGESRDREFLFLGRFAPQKKLDVIFEAVGLLQKEGKRAVLDVFGAARASEEAYAKGLRTRFAPLERSGSIVYRGSVLHDQTVSVYERYSIFIHLGSMRGSNKTLYEAMAAGCLVITGDAELEGVVHDGLFVKELTPESVAKALKCALALSPKEAADERMKVRAFALREHALSSVVPAVLEMLSRSGGQ